MAAVAEGAEETKMANQLVLAGLFAEGRTGGGIGGFLCLVLAVVGMWAVFKKAGEPGWAAIIPIYNLYVLRRVAGKSFLWFLLLLIPGFQVIPLFFVTLSIARKFGKGLLYGLALFFLPFLFYPALGLGSSTYGAYR
jgi:Family of unknown function (DUF5684)